jgi:transposase
MSHPNWLEIRTAYEAGGVGYRGLAERFNVGVATIARRAKKGGLASPSGRGSRRHDFRRRQGRH